VQIAGYLKTSLIEWPGKIVSVVFTPGCNFRCPFCHNADLVDPLKIKKLPVISANEVLADLKKRRKWVDGVTVTGGEPTLQKDLPEFLKKTGDLGFLRMIHTNGSNPDMIAQLFNCSIVDYVCLDVKGDFGGYEKFTKIQNSKFKIQNSIETIIRSGVEYEFRTTVVPGLHDLKNLISLAEQIKSLVQSCRWFLQQFRPTNCLDKSYLKIEPYSKEEMKNFQKELQKIIPNVFLRGI